MKTSQIEKWKATIEKNHTVGIDFGYISASNNSSKTNENEKNRENAWKLQSFILQT